MSYDQENRLSNQSIYLDADGEDKDIVIAFGSSLYRLKDISEALKQALFADQYSIWNKELAKRGMPQLPISSRLAVSGTSGKALGTKGQNWLPGMVRLRIAFEIIPDREIIPPQEIHEDEPKSPLDTFRTN